MSEGANRAAGRTEHTQGNLPRALARSCCPPMALWSG